MSDHNQKEDDRANRIARYKEERRQQLNSQIQARLAKENQVISKSTESQNAPRTTRASRLRAAATAANENGSSKTPGTPEKNSESTRTPPSPQITSSKTVNYTYNKDKCGSPSFNKSLNHETVFSKHISDDDKFNLQGRENDEISNDANQINKESGSCDSKLMLRFSKESAVKTCHKSNTTSTSTTMKSSPKKSQLAIHMENARKGISGKLSENTSKLQHLKKTTPSSTLECSQKHQDAHSNERTRNTEECTRKISNGNSRISRDRRIDEHKNNMNRLISLTALTKETLARVERLTNRNHNISPRHSPMRPKENCMKTDSTSQIDDKTIISTFKKINIEDSTTTTQRNASPVSILKRKTSVHESRQETATPTPPVTFSPNVKEPSTSNRKQGILKKRRSLDEALVLRRRSCSPDVASKSDSKSILKTHRRSSLEELTLIHSPEAHLQGILKRKTSKNDEDHDQSFTSPHSILKRRSGASSAGSTANSTPHVSITTAVILAAASGAEMILESKNASVKPILKKKSISDDQSITEYWQSDCPRPILKKKFSNDNDECCEDKPRPILKSSRGSLERESDKSIDADGEMKPILKQSKEDISRSRYSFCDEDGNESREKFRRQQRNARRSNTICADYISVLNSSNVDGLSNLKKQRPSSVFELNNVSDRTDCSMVFKGAIPKRLFDTNSNENSKLVDSQEKVSSTSYVVKSSKEPFYCQYPTQQEEAVEFPSLYKNINSDLDASSKLSTDSAFQSLTDTLDLEDVDYKISTNFPSKIDMESSNDVDVHNIPSIEITQDERDLKRLPLAFGESDTASGYVKGSSDTERTLKKKNINQTCERSKPNRYSTQPVTSEEIKEAIKMQPDDPANLSLTERIKLFNHKITKENKDHALDRKASLSDKPPRIGTKLNRSSSARIPDASTPRSNIKQALEGIFSKNKNQVASGNAHKVTVRRSNTTTVRKVTQEGEMPQSIAELQATLQRKGESEWRKRYVQTNTVEDELKLLKEKNKYNAEITEKTSILSSRKDELDAASRQWKYRVEKSDADKYSVSGKMDRTKTVIPVNIPVSDASRKAPQARRFKGKLNNSSSMPTSPEKNVLMKLKRSQSNPDPCLEALKIEKTTKTVKNVQVFRPDDFTFTSFFKNVDAKVNQVDRIDLNLDDLDSIQRHSPLVQRKNIRVQKRKAPSRNPIKALAEREDIKYEYTEVLTGVAERETKRLNIEKLAKSSSNFAVEALAGLASKEDFTAIPLKKNSGPSTLLPYKDLMLLQVKGRRHVQLRLVEPISASINEGDCYILIANGIIYNFIGSYSNIIEQSRAADIASHIQKTNDLGCKSSKIVTIDSKLGPDVSEYSRNFWNYLKDPQAENKAGAGNPSEDEIYEANIILTNMIYSLDKDELVPLDEYWGNLPKYEMLTATSVYVFDFGSEMYVWSGKNASSKEKQTVMKLAKELWDEGYNYTECSICPINVSLMLGNRTPEKLSKHASTRPDWALFSKITQHGETILFKEKFLDWPDFSRVIQLKHDINGKIAEGTNLIEPLDMKDMLQGCTQSPDIVIEGHHIGRGDTYYDQERNRLFEFETSQISMWRVMENTYELLPEDSHGHFYDGDSYIVKWKFSITVKGRELSGKPSKHLQVGRDVTVFFYWQGCNSSVNEKGLSALLTIELDNESAPQIRVTQGNEPAAFLRLFNGKMVIYKGKMNGSKQTKKSNRLFITRGEIEKETHLIEVTCNAHHLRSRSSLVLVNSEKNVLTIWHGCKSSQKTRKTARRSAEILIKDKPKELNLDYGSVLKEIEEREEDLEFKKIIGNMKNSYVSLFDTEESYSFTPRFFSFSSISGSFTVTELCCPHRSEDVTPFPVLQEQLYSASQPALFLIDNEHKLWLWQGWWPKVEEGGINTAEQTGSGIIRWQSERRAAMGSAVNYWRATHGENVEMKAELVWAGFEPEEFKNLFPYWETKEDVVELNATEGIRPPEKKNLEHELALLSRTEFPLAELLQRPLPEGVDPTHLEHYLSPDDFENALSITKEEFQKLPLWRQTSLKKERGLF